jgi:phage terminase large subunit-like protein
MSIGSWEAEYQQNPIVVGGGQLPIEKLKTVEHFERSRIVSSVRYVDKAGTVSDDAAYSAFVLMHLTQDKTYLIEHVMRGRWSALEREEKLKALCQADQQVCPDYRVWIEQEPGSGGKESVEATIRNLEPISLCGRTGSQIGSSNPSTILSITAATLGTPSSISLGKSCPSRAATGQQWDTQCEYWY